MTTDPIKVPIHRYQMLNNGILTLGILKLWFLDILTLGFWLYSLTFLLLLLLRPPDPAFLQTAQPDCERQQPGQSHRVPQRVEVAFCLSHSEKIYLENTLRNTVKIHLEIPQKIHSSQRVEVFLPSHFTAAAPLLHNIIKPHNFARLAAPQFLFNFFVSL